MTKVSLLRPYISDKISQICKVKAFLKLHFNLCRLSRHVVELFSYETKYLLKGIKVKKSTSPLPTDSSTSTLNGFSRNLIIASSPETFKVSLI